MQKRTLLMSRYSTMEIFFLILSLNQLINVSKFGLKKYYHLKEQNPTLTWLDYFWSFISLKTLKKIQNENQDKFMSKEFKGDRVFSRTMQLLKNLRISKWNNLSNHLTKILKMKKCRDLRKDELLLSQQQQQSNKIMKYQLRILFCLDIYEDDKLLKIKQEPRMHQLKWHSAQKLSKSSKYFFYYYAKPKIVMSLKD